MRIWIINHYATEASSNGMWGRHYNLALELGQKGYGVSVLASGYLHNQFYETRKYDNGLFDTELINGVQYIWIKTFPYSGNDWRRILNMVSFAFRVFKVGKKEPAPDLIIASSFHPLTWISGYKLARKHQARFVAEVRDLWPETPINMGAIKRNGFTARLMRKLERFIYRRAERIISVLPDAYKYITTLEIEPNKIVYIPNGANPTIYSTDGVHNSEINEFLQRYPVFLDESKFKVVYTGAHGLVNSIDTAVHAAQILQDKGINDILFLFVGAGPEKNSLIKMVDNRGLKNIRFCDPVSKTTVPFVLACADVCLLLGKDIPLYKYGISPNKLFDYMAAGKPIILTVNASNNIVNRAQCGLVLPPEDPEKLADALIMFSKLPKHKLESMGQNGQRYFIENHTYQALADILEKEVIMT